MEIQWFKATTSRWGDQAQQRGGLPNNLLESSCFNINIPPRTSKEDARAIFEFSSYLARLSFPPFKTLQRIPMTFWSKTALPLLRVANPVSFSPCLNNTKILIEWRWTENRWKINDNSPLFPGKKPRSIVPGQIWMPLNAVENLRKKKSDECGIVRKRFWPNNSSHVGCLEVVQKGRPSWWALEAAVEECRIFPNLHGFGFGWRQSRTTFTVTAFTPCFTWMFHLVVIMVWVRIGRHGDNVWFEKDPTHHAFHNRS